MNSVQDSQARDSQDNLMDHSNEDSGSTLTEGHKKAIVGMYAHGTSVADLARWYKVSQAEIREVLRPYVRLDDGRAR